MTTQQLIREAGMIWLAIIAAACILMRLLGAYFRRLDETQSRDNRHGEHDAGPRSANGRQTGSANGRQTGSANGRPTAPERAPAPEPAARDRRPWPAPEPAARDRRPWPAPEHGARARRPPLTLAPEHGARARRPPLTLAPEHGARARRPPPELAPKIRENNP